MKKKKLEKKDKLTYSKDVRKYIIREEEAQLVAMVSKKNIIFEREQKIPKFGLL